MYVHDRHVRSQMSSEAKELVSMGFKRSECEMALKENSNDVKRALDWLLGDGAKKMISEPPIKKQRKEVQQLIDLGYNEEQSKFALEVSGGNVQKV